MQKRLKWSIKRSLKSKVTIFIEGLLDEDTDLRPLLREIVNCSHVYIDLGGIERINSCGIREWVNFQRSFPPNVTVELLRCAPAVVSQINMISNFSSNARVVSIFAPFICDSCGEDEQVLLNVEDDKPPKIDGITCKHCGSDMIFDDIEESYFAFLTQANNGSKKKE